MPREPLSPWPRLASALLDKELGRIKDKIKDERPCTHPQSCVVQGRNQYGEWDRCLRCKTKLAYRAFSSKVEGKKKDKRGKEIVYVATTNPAEIKKTPKAKAEAASSSQGYLAPEELQSSLQESNHQLLTGMTTVLAQAITPLVSGQQALLEMTQQSMNNQTMLMTTVQQTQGAMAQAMTEMTQQIRRSHDEEEWATVADPPPYH